MALQSSAIDVLVMCTGNICRSPMAEVMLRARLEARGIEAHVHSAGLVLNNEPAHPHAQDVVTPLGLDLSHHRSRIIDDQLLGAADLIIGMEQRHVREVMVVEPTAFTRTFTLPDLVFRAEEVGPRVQSDLAAWLDELGEGRKRLDLLKNDSRLEVPDPMGASKRQFRRTADVLEDLLDRLVALAWPETLTSGHHGALAEHPTPIPRSI